MLDSNLLQGRNPKDMYPMRTQQLYKNKSAANASVSHTTEEHMLMSHDIRVTGTSSQQCIRAIASERRIMLSSWRTVILHDDLVTPEPSLWRRRLYCSTMKSSDSLEICSRTSLKSEHFYSVGAVLNTGLRAFQAEALWGSDSQNSEANDKELVLKCLSTEN